MNEEQIIDKVSMIDQWKVSGDSYTQGELDAIGQLLELYYDNKKQLEQEKEKNKNTGKLVKNKIDGTIGIVLREWETGQVQVLEKIQPKVINTHDDWSTLELIEESE